MNRLQQLNYYVKCKAAPIKPIPLNEEELDSAEWNFKQYDVVVLTEANDKTIIAVNNYCRKHNKKLIVADCHGVFGRVFNDFGDAFEVLDKNGEELQDCLIKKIHVGENALVELIPTVKHKLEDGDEVAFAGISGMTLVDGQEQPEHNKECKSGGINDTIWKVKVVSPYSFTIGDTRMFTEYQSGGLAKQLRPKLVLKYRSFEDCMDINKEPPLDENLAIIDFEKLAHNELNHVAYAALNKFREAHKDELPEAWSIKDAVTLYNIAMSLKPSWKDYKFDQL